MASLATTGRGALIPTQPPRRPPHPGVVSESPAAPDARPQSLELFIGHHGIDPLDPAGRTTGHWASCTPSGQALEEMALPDIRAVFTPAPHARAADPQNKL